MNAIKRSGFGQQQVAPPVPPSTRTAGTATASMIPIIGPAISAAMQNRNAAKINRAENDWTEFMGVLQKHVNPETGQQDMASAGSDPWFKDPANLKKLEKMSKALNVDWLNPKKTPEFQGLMQALHKDQQKKQATQGIRGLFQKLIQQRQQPQTTPEQRQEMGREVLSRAPISPPAPTNIAQIKDMVDLERAVTAARQKYEYHVTPEGVVAANKNDPHDAFLVRDSQSGQTFKGKNMPKEGQLYMVNGIPTGVFHGGQPVLPGDANWSEQDAKLMAGGFEGLKEKQFLRVDPIIAAQVGDPPLPSAYAKGRSDPEYGKALAEWGKQAQRSREQQPIDVAYARAKAWNEYGITKAMDADGNVFYTTRSNAIGMAPAEEGIKLKPREVQIHDIEVASSNARDAINGLDKSFSVEQIAKMKYAMTTDDENLANTELAALSSENLSGGQQDFVIWIRQLNERAMSLRNVAGMGVGAQDLRSAIRAMLPSIRSGSKEMMIKQLDAFDNQVSILKGGIAHPGITDTVLIKAPGKDGATKRVKKSEAQKYVTAGGTIVEEPKKK